MGQIIVDSLDIDDWFKTLPEKSDLLITDPPYAFDERNGAGRFKNMYSRFSWSRMEDIFKELYSRSNDGARTFVFCNRDGLTPMEKVLDNAGWTFRNLLVWVKVGKLGMGYHFRHQAEYIYYVSKDKPKVYITGRSNVFEFPKPTKQHIIPSLNYDPTKCISAKPWQIWEEILKHTLVEGDVLADPFAGTNPMRVALELNPTLKNKMKIAYTNSFEV